MKNVCLGRTSDHLVFQNQSRDLHGDISVLPLCILIIILCLNPHESSLNLNYEKSWCKHRHFTDFNRHGMRTQVTFHLSQILLYLLVHIWLDTLSSNKGLGVRPNTDMPFQFCLFMISIHHNPQKCINYLMLGSGREHMARITHSISALGLATLILPLV